METELQAEQQIATGTTGSFAEVLHADLYRYLGRTGMRAFAAAFFRHPGFRFTYFLRKVAHYRHKRDPFSRLAYWLNRAALHHYRFRYGFDISPTTKIGPGLYIGHFGGVVISPYAVLGANVNIAHGVTIGAASRGKRAGAPVIGDRVWIGTHAVIAGKVTIGDDALIAPGALVNFDVPAKAVVIGNPGQVTSYSGSGGYVNNVSGTDDNR